MTFRRGPHTFAAALRPGDGARPHELSLRWSRGVCSRRSEKKGAMRTRRSVRPVWGRPVLLLALVLVLAGVATPAGLALEPPRPGELTRLEREGALDESLAFARALGNQRMSPALLESARMRAERAVLGLAAPAPPPARRGMPTTGHVKVLALLIEFDDYRHSNEASDHRRQAVRSGCRRWPVPVREPPRLLPALLLRPARHPGQRARLVPHRVRPLLRGRDGRRTSRTSSRRR